MRPGIITRTWKVPRQDAERINELAESLRVHPSDLVTWMLRAGLDRVEDGRWRINAKPIVWRVAELEGD